MAIFFVTDVQQGTGNQVNLGVFDELFITPTGQVISTNTDAVEADSRRSEINVDGQIYAVGSGINLFSSSGSTNFFHTFNIGETGTIRASNHAIEAVLTGVQAGDLLVDNRGVLYGHFAAIDAEVENLEVVNYGLIASNVSEAINFDGQRADIENHGEIRARQTGDYAIRLDGAESGNYHHRIENYGTIVGHSSSGPSLGNAIYSVRGAASVIQLTLENHGVINGKVLGEGSTLVIENTGIIRGSIDAAALVTLDDDVYNEGMITGSIDLEAGNDVLVNNGRIIGFTDMGNGDDTLVLLEGSRFNQSVDGGSNTDVVDTSQMDRAVWVDLHVESLSEVTLTGKVKTRDSGDLDTGLWALNAKVTSFENVIGSDYDDYLRGDDNSNLIVGGDGDDSILGFGGADTLEGGEGNDTLRGTEGVNILNGDGGEDKIYGGDDADDLSGGLGADTLVGNGGNDSILGEDDDDVLYGNDGEDTLDGGEGNDWFSGGNDDDSLFGWLGEDTIAGGNGNDSLFGEDDDDELDGGGGQDLLNGGLGADVFVFDAVSDSAHGTATRDEIQDFENGVDLIDLSGIMAGLTFIGTAAYSGAAGEVRFNDAIGRLYINTDANAGSDFSIDLTGVTTLDATDLIL